MFSFPSARLSGNLVTRHSSLVTLLDPLHRLVRQLVEGGHTHLQMFFFRVLDFVVADAVQALHIMMVGTPARATSAAI